MLVLTRKQNESIQIGEEVEITILSIQGDQVKIGIQAPKHIDIHRKEVYRAIQKANQQAASQAIDVQALMKYSKSERSES